MSRDERFWYHQFLLAGISLILLLGLCLYQAWQLAEIHRQDDAIVQRDFQHIENYIDWSIKAQTEENAYFASLNGATTIGVANGIAELSSGEKLSESSGRLKPYWDSINQPGSYVDLPAIESDAKGCCDKCSVVCTGTIPPIPVEIPAAATYVPITNVPPIPNGVAQLDANGTSLVLPKGATSPLKPGEVIQFRTPTVW